MQRVVRHIVLLLSLALTGFGAQVAQAKHASSIAVECHRFEALDTGLETLRGDPDGWTCDSSDWRSDNQSTWMRFAVGEASQGKWQTATLAIRTARFEKLSIFAENEAGEIAHKSIAQSAIKPLGRGPYATAKIPEVGGDLRYVYARMENTELPSTGSQARLFETQADAGWPLGQSLLIAALLGLVLAPLFFDLTLYPVLKKSYLLWHAGIVTGMLVSLAFGTGIAAAIFPLSVNNLVGGLEAGYVLIIGAAGFFTASFIEREALSPNMRRALIGSSIIVLVLSGGLAIDFPPMRWIDHQFYLLGFLPALLATLAALSQAVMRGSFWVRYQIVGWVPGILCGIDIVSAAFGFTKQPAMPDTAPFAAMGFEILITGIGVIHRLNLLRRERDNALEEARTLEKLSERDPMTGLLNRRAIDARFEELHRSGYETFAVIDLDHFKLVNDVAGHAKGDEVLKVTASVMKDEKDCIAMRLGGEEFLLLMKGPNAFERAEKVRQAIPVRIAREVLELEQIVTASMGLVQVPSGAMPKAVFSDIYSHADRLLYEAKEQGRNRTVSEKMRGFRGRLEDRRAAAA